MKRFLMTACAALAVAAGLGQIQAPQGLRRGGPLLNRRPGLMRPGLPGAGQQQQQQEQVSTEEAKEAIKNAPRGTNGVPVFLPAWHFS